MQKLLPFLLLITVQCAGASSLPTLTDSLTAEHKLVARAAFDELKALPRSERQKRLKNARKEIKNFKAARRAGKEADTDTLLLVVLAILLPPLAVYLHEQETNTKFWITLLLFLLGIAGAVFFSWLLIFAAVVYALLVIMGAA
jgi:uncharacterized membrane protein YqaE (UPF0057 family)